jgi:hypothetical protein
LYKLWHICLHKNAKEVNQMYLTDLGHTCSSEDKRDSLSMGFLICIFRTNTNQFFFLSLESWPHWGKGSKIRGKIGLGVWYNYCLKYRLIHYWVDRLGLITRWEQVSKDLIRQLKRQRDKSDSLETQLSFSISRGSSKTSCSCLFR